MCLDEAGKPSFNDLLFRRRDPVYVAFDVLNVEGADVRAMPLKDRRAILDRIAEQHAIQKSELFFGCGKTLFKAVSADQVVEDSEPGLFPEGRTRGAFRPAICVTACALVMAEHKPK